LLNPLIGLVTWLLNTYQLTAMSYLSRRLLPIAYGRHPGILALILSFVINIQIGMAETMRNNAGEML
jgi:hypothetical protein